MDWGKGKASGTELIYFGIHFCEDTKEKYIAFSMAAIFFEQLIISSNLALTLCFQCKEKTVSAMLGRKGPGFLQRTQYQV